MSPHKTKEDGSFRRQLRVAAVSASISILLLWWGSTHIESLTAARLSKGLLWPLCRLLMFIGIGLVVGEVIEASGWTRYMAVVSRPLFRFGNLGDHCGAAFTTAFFSGTAANAMLLDFYQDGKICKKQLFLANLMNHFPAYFLHLPTTVFIVIPLTGWAGAAYFLLTFSALILRCFCFLLYGHLHPSIQSCDLTTVDTTGRPPPPEKSAGSIMTRIRRKLPGRILRIAVWVIPIYILVFVLNARGVFTIMRDWMADAVVTTFIPVESLSVVILSFVAEFTSGFAAAGALMDAGVLTVKQTALALLIGNIIAFPVRALRHQLPRYIGIFSPKLGTQLLLLGQSCRIVSLIIAGIVYYLVA